MCNDRGRGRFFGFGNGFLQRLLGLSLGFEDQSGLLLGLFGLDFGHLGFCIIGFEDIHSVFELLDAGFPQGNQLLVDFNDGVAVIGDQFIHLPFFHGSGVFLFQRFDFSSQSGLALSSSEVTGGDSSFSQLINSFFGGKFAFHGVAGLSEFCLRLAGFIQRFGRLGNIGFQSPNIFFESFDFGLGIVESAFKLCSRGLERGHQRSSPADTDQSSGQQQ